MSKQVKQYYLVTETEWFFDGHGVPEEGGINKFITTDTEYSLTKKGKYYNDLPHPDMDEEELKEVECDLDDMQATDGYNRTASTYKVKKIKLEDVEEIKALLKAYNKL